MLYHIILNLSNETSLLEQLVNNTKYDWMPGFFMSLSALIISILSAYYAIRTFNSQKETERNTGKLNKSEQHRLLSEMTRHLYRNFVVSYSIGVKMIAKNFTVYPSEEHIKKMKVELGDIHLNLFYRFDNEHEEMNKLYMELRNYNIELDIICNHFQNPDIEIRTKIRDLHTMYFKCNYLTERITEIINLIWYNNGGKSNVYTDVCSIISNEISKKNNMPGQVYSLTFDNYTNKDSFYVKELFAHKRDWFINEFNENVRHECGLNSEGAEKIHMIDLRPTKFE